MNVKEWLSSFLFLFFPRCCAVCGHPLSKGEECICTTCNINLPRTNFHLREDNPVEQIFWGKIPIGRATSFFFYRKGSNFRRILYGLKYEGKKEVGEVFGRMIASELISSGFFKGIDVIVPVPLHPRKLKRRGYNQSEWIARGVSLVSGIPLDTISVIREKYTDTQTHKSSYERWENVEGIFILNKPQSLYGAHILIIDDVLTTGSTITACADVFQKIENVRISVLTLAIAES